VSTTWLVDETYVKILGKWHYLYRGVDQDGQVLDCWLSQTRDLVAAEAFFRRTISSTGCTPEHVVTDKASFYPSAIRTCAPGAKRTATGFYNLVISTNRCERNHEIADPSHARIEEFRVRHTTVCRLGRGAAG
jgi:putative transposase